jgi:predicted HAD superfamily Cof-like phosphohydrolase
MTINKIDPPNQKGNNMTTFNDKIKAFNKLYGLPVLDVPGIPFKAAIINNTAKSARKQLHERILDLQAILTEEVREADEICNMINAGDEPEEVLTALADWLGDLQIYCASEMAKFGLDNDMVLGIIMASNMSKLGEDGQPIYDERGKVMKGPNYWKPEPQIKRYIQVAWRQSASAEEEDQS